MTHSGRLILFDLDGTLVDPAGAITGGIAAALAVHGLDVPPVSTLNRMVGPPLMTGLRELAGVPEDRLADVVGHYRETYRSTGMRLSRPYAGIMDVVEQLHSRGDTVAVATQKPQWLACELLEVQGMSGLFDSIHGSPADERAAAALPGKQPIIAAALARHDGKYDGAVMVGDRSHDVDGAAANGLPCVGVRWGFAVPGELETAGALRIADNPAHLGCMLTADDRVFVEAVQKTRRTVVHGAV